MANRNLSKRSDKMNGKMTKNNVSSNIYGSSLQNTKDHTQNIKMINEKIRNESISFSKTSVNQSQEELRKDANTLSNSMQILNGAQATINFPNQKTNKAKSIAANHKQKISDQGVYHIMPTQTQ